MTKPYPISTPIQLASTIRALRKSRNLSQEELGQLLGVNQKRIARIEATPARTSFDQISRLVAALGGRLEIRVFPEEETKNRAKGTREAW